MDLGSLLSSFTKFAFRVEGLPDYQIPGERQFFDLYKRGEPLPAGYNAGWEEILLPAVDRGATVERLRLVSSPLSEYERFELVSAYSAGIAAGERIRVIQRPADPPPDFWIVDNEWIGVMKYDDHGGFLGVDVHPLDGSYLVMSDKWRGVFAREAATVDEYVQSLPQ